MFILVRNELETGDMFEVDERWGVVEFRQI